MKAKIRCDWVSLEKEDYVDYHDKEWGRPIHDDQLLFEMLCLEGAQAGLSWYTILKKRDYYRTAFKHFDIKKVAHMKDSELEKLLVESEIVRNRLKVYSVRSNAQAVLAIQKEYGSLDAYLWSFVGGTTKVHHPKNMTSLPQSIPESIALTKELKKRGMKFVGGSITYAFMQAVGMIDDHMEHCFLSQQKKKR